MRVAKQWLPGAASSSSATLIVGLGSLHTHLGLLFKMVHSISDESVWIVSVYFRAKMGNYVSGFELNENLF